MLFPTALQNILNELNITLHMNKFLYIGLLVLAVSAVGVADAFLKKASISGGLVAAIKSRWMLGAVILYLFQIFFFTYVFVAGFKLSVVSILQTGLYAIITLASGILFFQESLSTTQIIGIISTLVGVIILNF